MLRMSADELKRTINGEEKWIYGYDLEAGQQSNEYRAGDEWKRRKFDNNYSLQLPHVCQLIN